jgi:uncharacterized protein (DUF433 family)
MGEPLIVSDPKVMMGKPVIAGTRVTVELILEKLGSGESIEQVLESLQFAAQALRAEAVYPVATQSG